MGEQADYFLQDVEEYERLRAEWRTGNLPDEEVYELGIIDEMGREITDGS